MFEFLEDHTYFNDNFSGEVVGFNKNTNNLIVEGGDKNTDEERNLEVSIFDSKIVQDIDEYENWEEKLYNTLIKNRGIVDIFVLSTESGNGYNLSIYKNKTLLNTHEYSEKLVLINYAIVFADKIKGDILSFQEIEYHANDELKKFTKWIDNQIYKVSEFNYSQQWNTFNSIIVSDAFNTSEELKLLWHLFNEKWFKTRVREA
ncbi:hypothetical protein ACFHWD_03620 [Clostridium sp. MT-14]|uniref:hypothetical protein n=1 Tax=Clostridium sp. MT-14 TaxID=3348360 RepID=UPI0035F4F495